MKSHDTRRISQALFALGVEDLQNSVPSMVQLGYPDYVGGLEFFPGIIRRKDQHQLKNRDENGCQGIIIKHLFRPPIYNYVRVNLTTHCGVHYINHADKDKEFENRSLGQACRAVKWWMSERESASESIELEENNLSDSINCCRRSSNHSILPMSEPPKAFDSDSYPPIEWIEKSIEQLLDKGSDQSAVTHGIYDRSLLEQ